MNALTVAIFACVVILASAKPSGIWGVHGGHGYGHGYDHGYDHGYGHGYGHGHGHLPLVGASGVVSSGGAVGPTGLVNGHGAVGPNGIPNAIHGGAHVGVGIDVHGAHGAWKAGDDGQWHGEGLLESQDWAGHGAGVVAPAAVIAPAIVGVHGLGIGLGHGHGYGHGHGHGW